MKPFDIAYFKEVTSTNEQVKKALRAHANERYVCRARKQTGGYGRQGRLWTSPEGGLYQSLLLRPGGSLEKLPTLGFVMALSIRAALLRLAAVPPETVQVKWPNDLMVDDDKIAGISMEATSGGVCIGMGVNVFKPDETAEILSDSRYQPAYFSAIPKWARFHLATVIRFPTNRMLSMQWEMRFSRHSINAIQCGRKKVSSRS